MLHSHARCVIAHATRTRSRWVTQYLIHREQLESNHSVASQKCIYDFGIPNLGYLTSCLTRGQNEDLHKLDTIVLPKMTMIDVPPKYSTGHLA